MEKVIPVFNQCFRKITETEKGWRCELLNKDGSMDKDWMFWNFNIPKEYLKDKWKKMLEFTEFELLDILDNYINYIDELRATSTEVHLYKNGYLIGEFQGGRKAIYQYVMENKNEYPNASVGVASNGFHWIVDLKMNIKGIYFYEDLEARPIINGKELRV